MSCLKRDSEGRVDDLAFFQEAFTDTDIASIYDVGLPQIMSITPVEPQDKVTTMWASMKQY